MAQYRLHPVGTRSDRDDLTLEIEGHRAKVYNDRKVFHDWGYVDCVDYVQLPGLAHSNSWQDWVQFLTPLSHIFGSVGHQNYGVLIGSQVHFFVISERCADELRRFWERGYVLRNPDAARTSLRKATLWLALCGCVCLSVIALLALVLFVQAGQNGQGGAGGVALFPLALVAIPALQAWRHLNRRSMCRRVARELEDEGTALPHPATHEPYPPPKIDVVTGRAHRR
ncbi:MAG TPA: hypothetical protein VGE74_24845 [Gemmata sp.]